jgi:hypothetical protein
MVMADFPSLDEVIADIKQGNPDMSDAAARTAAQKVLGDMQGEAKDKYKKRQAEGKENFKSGGKVKGYKKGKMVRGAGCAKKGVRKCKMR